jgi:methionyl-tRNA formyltransferase
MRVVFFGTPELSVPFLSALVQDHDIEVVGVVTQPDKPFGRKQVLTASPVKQEAERLGLRLYQPSSLKNERHVERLREFSADVFVVVAYGKIIPESVLAIPRLGCLNVHPSLLPRHRGPSPMPFSIREGDRETGVTIMLLDHGMDTGPLLAATSIAIEPRETLATLTRKVMQVGPPLLVATVKEFASGRRVPTPQDPSKATITKLLSREDGRIDWKQTANEVDRQIRAFDPWPGTWTVWMRNGKETRLKILEAIPSDRSAAPVPGTVVVENGRVFVSCRDRMLDIIRLQPEGSAAMDAQSFSRGYSDVNGVVLA